MSVFREQSRAAVRLYDELQQMWENAGSKSGMWTREMKMFSTCKNDFGE